MPGDGLSHPAKDRKVVLGWPKADGPDEDPIRSEKLTNVANLLDRGVLVDVLGIAWTSVRQEEEEELLVLEVLRELFNDLVQCRDVIAVAPRSFLHALPQERRQRRIKL